MKLKIGYQELIQAAMAEIETVPVEHAKELLTDPNVVFMDIRDVRELEREGMVPNAIHAPRGMLEFWADPESPYYKPVFGEGKKLVLYCASAWRSARRPPRWNRQTPRQRLQGSGGARGGWRFRTWAGLSDDAPFFPVARRM